jgi:hypothetical protein
VSTCEEQWARHEALERRLGLTGAPGVPARVEQRSLQMGTTPIVARRLPRIPFGLGTGALAGGVMGAVTGSSKPWWWLLGGAVLGGGCSIWNAYAEYRESQIIIEQGGVALPAGR